MRVMGIPKELVALYVNRVAKGNPTEPVLKQPLLYGSHELK
jgi:hypothetical protein